MYFRQIQLSEWWEWRRFFWVLILAALVRFVDLQQESFWVDEIATVKLIAQRSFLQLWEQIQREEINPPLYFIGVWGWTRLFGASEWGVRSFSALLGWLAVFLFARLAQRVLPKPWDLFSTLLFSIAPAAVAFSREARMYALFLFFSLWVMLMFWDVLLKGDWKKALWAVIPMTLAMYTHPYGVFLPLIWSIGVLRRRTVRVLWVWFVPALIASVAFVPWLLHWYQWWEQGVLAQKQWIAPLSWKAPLTLALLFAGWLPPYPTAPSALLQLPALLGLLGILLVGSGVSLASVVGGMTLWRYHRGALIWRQLYWIGIPVLGAVIISAFVIPIWVARYFLFVFPALLLWVCATMAVLDIALLEKLAWRSFIALLLGFSLLSLRLFVQPPKEQWREAAAWIAQHAQPGDCLLLHPGFLQDAVAYYLQRQDLASVRFPIVPRKLTWNDADSVRQLVQPYPRVWYVYSPRHYYDQQGVILSTLQQRRRQIAQRSFSGVTVVLYAAVVDLGSPEWRKAERSSAALRK